MQLADPLTLPVLQPEEACGTFQKVSRSETESQSEQPEELAKVELENESCGEANEGDSVE